ncbi:hypothetical protein ABMA28_011191 [Loxostege sticticalis]|uniref:RRM domain-containing protein n=1 Tax=Loxostege sticticalis TaxID=481309 RepID=A0ABD0S721_LOXSC
MVEAASMEKQSPKKPLTRKRKKKTKSPVEEKTMKLEVVSEPVVTTKQNAGVQKTECPKVMFEGLTMEEIGEKYPILKNDELVQRFLNVPLTNNQKGRIRTVLRDNLKGTSDNLLPDVIHDRIQAVLKSSTDLTDTDLRKIRILYNMLKTAIKAEKSSLEKKEIEKNEAKKKPVKKEKEKEKKDDDKDKPEAPKQKKEPLVKKIRGQKRYVVFLGNLPMDIDKEKIMQHFSELSNHIVDVRIPKAKEDKKSAIAYVELKNEPTYELALSKHHSMLGNRRINVLYSTQKNSKISKAEAKSKSAKLVALQKSGKLIGSTAANKKRSHRRAILKRARAKENQA